MPGLRGDYVSNSNDSYWLSNPALSLEGYSPVIGDEGTARSLRTRAGLSQLAELQQGGGKVSPQDYATCFTTSAITVLSCSTIAVVVR